MTLVSVIIPAFNEEKAIHKVIRNIPSDLITEIVVIDNGSTDLTSRVAKHAGATVLVEKEKGYGSACLKGIEYLKNKTSPPDIVIFLDSDYSDFPEQMDQLIDPIINHDFDFVIGSRSLGVSEKGSMTIPQIIGNKIAAFMMKILFKAEFSDLGPFRAIKFDKLLDLKMKDRNYGWTVEMQVKAVKQNLKYTEVPVDYRKRIGVSKVSGTFKGTILAGYKIIWTILKFA